MTIKTEGRCSTIKSVSCCRDKLKTMMSLRQRFAGFTLIELAISFFIISLLLVGILGPMGTRIEQTNRAQTEAQLDQIRDALYGHVMANGWLPYPDCPNNMIPGCDTLPAAVIDDGQEDLRAEPGATRSCVAGPEGVDPVTDRASLGNLPWMTLGVSRTDAWGNTFGYVVTETFADDIWGTGCGVPRLNVSFELCSNGENRIFPNDLAVIANTPDYDNIPAMVVSYGKNGFPTGASSAHEQENFDGDRDAIQKPFARLAAEEFDDLLIWLPPNVLRNRMVVAGQLP